MSIVGKFYCKKGGSQGNSCVEIIDANDSIYSIPGHPSYPAINQVRTPGVASKISLTAFNTTFASPALLASEPLYNSQSACETDCSNHYPWNCWSGNNGNTVVGQNSFYHLTTSQKNSFCEVCHNDTGGNINKVHPYCWCINPQNGGTHLPFGSVWTKPPKAYTCDSEDSNENSYEECGTCGSAVEAPIDRETQNSLLMKVDFIAGEHSLIPSHGGNITITISGASGSVFSLEIEDDNECSILKSPLKDITIPVNGKYTLNQEFPTVGSSDKQYTFTLSENLHWEALGGNPENTFTVIQHPYPIVTFVQSSDSGATTNPQTLTLAGDNVITTGAPLEPISTRAITTLTWNNTSKRYENKTTTTSGTKDVSWTATKASGYAGNLYISRPPNNSDINTGRSYIGVVNKEVKDSQEIEISSNTANVFTNGAVISKFTKTVKENIGIESCYQNTNKFELDNVLNLSPGMHVEIPNHPGALITDVNLTERIITITRKLNIRKDTKLIFSFTGDFGMVTVKDHNTITTESKVSIPKGVEINFWEGCALTDAALVATGSGSGTITITGTFLVVEFEKQNETHTLNVDNFITNTPNAYDQDIYTAKDTAQIIKMILFDSDLNASDKTGVVISGPSHGSVSSFDGEASTITYTPHPGYIGEDKFTFTMSDGTNTSDEKTIYINVI